MSQTPRVTVLIPVYNRERYIASAIDSILAQTFTDFELLVLDDASTDGSMEIVSGYTDTRIRIEANPVNLGIPKTRNRGLEMANGEYLAFLDSDDVAAPERLARQVSYLESNPQVAAVGAWISWIDDAGRQKKKIKRKACDSNSIAAQRLFRAGLENSAAMGRLSILREYGHNEDYQLGSDYDLWARIAAEHRLANIPEVLVYRRQHQQRTTEGQTQRIMRFRLQIYASQLEKLGVMFTDTDLENHYLLRRMQKTEFHPDRNYLDWAEQWLLKLQTANRQKTLYPEPEFTEVLASFWLKTCVLALRHQGFFAVHRFYRSSLRKSVLSGLRRQVYGHVLSASRFSQA